MITARAANSMHTRVRTSPIKSVGGGGGATAADGIALSIVRT